MNDHQIESAFQAASDRIAQDIVGRLEGAAPAPEGIVTSPAPAGIVTSPDAQAAQPAAPPAVQTPAQPDPTVAALLARLADLESQVAAARQPQPQPTPVTPAPTRQFDPSELANQLRYDPYGALEAAGLDPTTVARGLVARVMGDQAPPALQAQAALAPQLGQFQQVISDLQRQVQSLGSELKRRDYQSGLAEHVGTLDNVKFPAVTALHKQDRNWVSTALMQIVRDDAAGRQNQPGAAPLTPEEAVRRLEEKLSPVYRAFAPATPAPAQNAQPVVPAVQPAPAPTAAALTGAPAPATGTSYEDKVALIMQDVLRKYQIT